MFSDDGGKRKWSTFSTGTAKSHLIRDASAHEPSWNILSLKTSLSLSAFVELSQRKSSPIVELPGYLLLVVISICCCPLEKKTKKQIRTCGQEGSSFYLIRCCICCKNEPDHYFACPKLNVEIMSGTFLSNPEQMKWHRNFSDLFGTKLLGCVAFVIIGLVG